MKGGVHRPAKPPENTTPPSQRVLPQETLADAIGKISASVRHLSHSGLNRDAIIVLVADDTKLPKRTISHVLDSLEELRTRYGSR